MRPRWIRTRIVFGVLIASMGIASAAPVQGAGAKAGAAGAPQVAPPAASATAGATPDRTPGEIFKDAREAYKKGDYETALKGFQAVWAVEKRAKVAGNLGRTELKLKRYRDAAEHLELFMRIEEGMKPEERASVFAELNEAKSHVATLRVVVVPDASEVLIDGVSVGTSPIDHDVFVEAGHHKIEARSKGMTDTKEIDTKEGSEWPVKLEVPEKKADTVDKKPPPSPFPMRIVILSAGAGVAVIGGILMGVAAGQKSSALDQVPTDGNGTPLCSKTAGQDHGSPEKCAQIRGMAGTADTTWGVGMGFLIVGGVAAAGAAVSWLIPDSGKAPKKATSRVLPVVGANGVGVLWQGSF